MAKTVSRRTPDEAGQDYVEGRQNSGATERPPQDVPSPGPHATPDKLMPERAPGDGTLPDSGQQDTVEPGTG